MLHKLLLQFYWIILYNSHMGISVHNMVLRNLLHWFAARLLIHEWAPLTDTIINTQQFCFVLMPGVALTYLFIFLQLENQNACANITYDNRISLWSFPKHVTRTSMDANIRHWRATWWRHITCNHFTCVIPTRWEIVTHSIEVDVVICHSNRYTSRSNEGVLQSNN